MDPPHDRRVRQRKPTLGHHLDEITKTEFVPQIPAHAEHDDLPVEMATFEKIINVQHAWLGSSRANLSPNMRHTHASHQNRAARGGEHRRTLSPRGHRLIDVLWLVKGVPGGRQTAACRRHGARRDLRRGDGSPPRGASVEGGRRRSHPRKPPAQKYGAPFARV